MSNPYLLEKVSGQMVEATLPSLSTPKMVDRIESFEDAQSKLARLSLETIFSVYDEGQINPKVIVPLGIYATRVALNSILRNNNVDDARIIGETVSELHTFSHFLREYIDTKSDDGGFIGYASELGMANMMWSGIKEGKLELSYAVLMGVCGREKDHSGLRGDVDLIIRRAKDNQRRQKIQVKASEKRKNYVYEDGIIVVTAQGLLSTSTPEEAVIKLLNWGRVKSGTKDTVYERFNDLLNAGQTRKKLIKV